MKVYVEVFVERSRDLDLCCLLERSSDLVAQLEVRFRLMMRDSHLWNLHLDLSLALG